MVSVLFLALSVLAIQMVDRNILPVLKALCEARAQMAVSDAMNACLNDNLIPHDYNDLLTVHYDSDGDISLIEANSLKISYLKAIIGTEMELTLSELAANEVHIPLGQVFGRSPFMSMGPDLSIRIEPIGNVNVEVMEEFESAGINQTRHQIYLLIETNLRVIIPPVLTDITETTTFPICDYVIVGQVPQVFMGGSVE